MIKFGGLALSPSGTPGGDVAYWFDPASNWSAEEQSGWLSGLALWSAVANIEFTPAADASSSDFIIYRQPNQPGGASGGAGMFSPNMERVPIGGMYAGSPGADVYIAIDTSVPGFGPIGDDVGADSGYPYFTLVHESGICSGSDIRGRTTPAIMNSRRSRPRCSSAPTIPGCGRSCPTSMCGTAAPHSLPTTR